MQSRKRKAPTQLSPYEKEENVPQKDVRLSTNVDLVEDPRVKTKKFETSYGGKFSKIFSETNLFPDLQDEDEIILQKMSSLNLCFMNSIKTILGKDTSKNLNFLFEQYNKHMENIYKCVNSKKSPSKL